MKKILTILFLFAFVQGQAQRDSLLNVIETIKKTPVDTTHINRLKDLGYDLMETDSLLSGKLLEEALAKSLKTKDNTTIANCYRLLGVYHLYFNQSNKALQHYKLSLKHSLKSKNMYLYGGVCYNIGNVYYYKSEYDSCIHYYTKASDAFDSPNVLTSPAVTEKLLDKRKSDLYSNFSAVFNTLGNLKKADEYINKAIAIAEKYDSPAAADAKAYYMQQKADNYHQHGFFKEALNIRLAFLPQMEKSKGTRESVQSCYQNIANEYLLLHKIDSAAIFADKSLKLATTIQSISGIAHSNRLLGRLAMEQNKFDEAEKYLEIVKPYYENSEDLNEKRAFYEDLYKLKDKLGLYKEAMLYVQKFITINDSLLVGEKARQFSEIEAKYENQKKQSKIELQQEQIKRKNMLNYIFVGSTFVLLLISFLGYYSYRNKQKLQQVRIDELETEKQLSATEAILKGEERERTRLAKDLHDGLGGMLSSIKYSFQNIKENVILTPENAQSFSRSIEMIDSSIQEMRRVAHNMMPEILLKYGLNVALKEFCSEIDRNSAVKTTYQSINMDNIKVEQTTAVTVYRVVQELTNNALKHANAQNILVQLNAFEQEKMLYITVEDDGKGFDINQLNNSNGIGWNNIQNRIDFLKGKIDLESIKNKGTSVHIEIPLL